MAFPISTFFAIGHIEGRGLTSSDERKWIHQRGQTMSEEPKSERLGLRGTLDLISNALRTADTANATGAITAGAS
jgi:hypothetical protein